MNDDDDDERAQAEAITLAVLLNRTRRFAANLAFQAEASDPLAGRELRDALLRLSGMVHEIGHLIERGWENTTTDKEGHHGLLGQG